MPDLETIDGVAGACHNSARVMTTCPGVAASVLNLGEAVNSFTSSSSKYLLTDRYVAGLGAIHVAGTHSWNKYFLNTHMYQAALCFGAQL